MAKITLHGMFARIKGKFNKSETLYFKGCPCKQEQLCLPTPWRRNTSNLRTTAKRMALMVLYGSL